ncbi:glycosyltransferase family 4 protein [Sphingomonas koreensis]|uniref:Glycosyltransferase family 4 protein n=1 Tax=Sphingomonas koreensis TaxID=93064 RepID=A0AAJ4S598_9SPHN|nr:glycosyltransferase family 4 protein [Sphingomonas koreensis]RSU34561.1 glycosyltransferase family 4 protein [Sphingomonas koreensis]RSU35437.1 glycosyltransferase family 4 protein [Sphingomonas koreensis]RSU39750.1 glycosyltransferase family 4 protein [Sphingomonas koreensis]RSU43238.1 glycosyltransferase family 4 protein [Sphingomonas koreensis]
MVGGGRVNIAFVLSALGAGGAERVISSIAGAAIARGWTVTVITFDAPDDPIFHAIDPRAQLIRLAVPAGSGGLSAYAAGIRRARALRRALDAGKYDVVISFLTKINVLTLLATLGRHTPVIVSERNNPDRQPAHPLWQMMLHRLYPRAAGIVTLTERGKTRMRIADRSKVTVIPNPIPALAFEPRREKPPQLVAVGRLTEQKGFDLLIDAFAGIAARFPDWSLVIFGEGPERPRLEAMVRDHGLQHRIRLPGNTERHAEWISAASMFVLSSRYEGFANVVGEAMRAGLAVVASDCDFGPGEMIEQEVSGLLVPPEDCAQLATALGRVMSSGTLLRRLGSNAKRRATLFDERIILDRWLGLIASAADRQPATSSGKSFRSGSRLHALIRSR